MTKNRHGAYVFQIRIPQAIRDNNPHLKPVLQKSLKTFNRRSALHMARKWMVLMVENKFDYELQLEREDMLFHVGKPIFTDVSEMEQEGERYQLGEYLAMLSQSEKEALSFVSEQCYALEIKLAELLSSGLYKQAVHLYENAPRVYQNQLKKVLNRARIDHQQNAKVSVTSQPISNSPQHSSSRMMKDCALDIAFAQWEKDNQLSMQQASYEEYHRMISLFIKLIVHCNKGEMPLVSELNNALIDGFRAIFEKIPKGSKVQTLTAEKIIKLTGNPKSSTTVKNNLSNMGHFINFLDDRKYPIDKEIHGNLTSFRKIRAKEKKKRVPLDEKDLIALFHSDEYQNGMFKRGSDFWAPLIALFSGGCRNEIIQLELDDIKEVDGIPALDINDNGDKQLKVDSEDDEGGSGRPRILPIHPQLLKLGFLDYVAWVREKKETRLFPEEVRNNRGHFGSYGNRFARYRKKHGVVPRNDKEFRDFHSFRHLMSTNLNELVADSGLIDDIIGHSSSSRSTMNSTYNSSNRVNLKLEAIEKIRFPYLDFSSIKPWQQQCFAVNGVKPPRGQSRKKSKNK